MDSRKSIRVLAKSIHSLLGLKKHLTSNWVDSVFNIIKSSPSQGPLEIGCNKYKNDVDLGIAILKIRDELAALTANIHQLNTQKRQVLNDLLDLKGNIRVFCRVRPITMGENLSHQTPVVTLDSSRLLLNFAENKSRIYSFDKIFHPGSPQDDIFQEVDPLIKSALDGYNACIFAYGQTGTGKTFTMEGTADNPGVIPRAIEAVFKEAANDNHTFLFSFSMLEIYMGHLKDLLVPQTIKATGLIPPCLSIQTNSKGEINIDNLVTIQVSNFNHAKRLYRLGCRFRSTASTNLNKSSSRSHCMIRILMTCFDATERRRITNKLWMIDLGGSERVLKTKACGRRFEEGKAINLSLSALGDVVNALQRKKGHIPYRNSKLTQVLKDSLGEDSKTLMLVHVSPKEEDLCETLCSLNFATRVRSIHLGEEESTEVKEQKEIEMISLQQRMKWIEDKCHEVRRDIKKLNEKLEELTGAPTSSSKKLEASHLPSELEVPQHNIEIANNIGNITASLSSELPRFMRPTICSRRKPGVDHQTSDGKKTVSGRKKTPQSHHAESVILPMKGISEYNSESSISRINCLVGSKLKFSSDNETESSQNKSENNIKMIIFPTQDKSPRSSKHKKSQSSCSEEHGNRKMHEFDSSKFSKVDDWLHLQKNAYYPSTCTHQNKWILAIPNPVKNSRHNQQGVQKQLHYEQVGDYKLSKEKIGHEELNGLIQVEAAGRSRSEVVANIMPTRFKDFSNGDSISNSISPTHTNDDVSTIQAQGMGEEFSVEEYICSNSTPPESCSMLNKKQHGSRVGEMPMQLIACETQFSESLMLNSSRPSTHSASDVSGRTTPIIEDISVSISRSELKSQHKKEPSKISKSSEKEEFHASSQHFEAGIQQRLSINKPNQVDLAKPIFQSQGKAKSTGIFDALKQKIQILCTSALLGLGFQSLGLEHDFFYALML